MMMMKTTTTTMVVMLMAMLITPTQTITCSDHVVDDSVVMISAEQACWENDAVEWHVVFAQKVVHLHLQR
jgi:hypothetical protein